MVEKDFISDYVAEYVLSLQNRSLNMVNLKGKISKPELMPSSLSEYIGQNKNKEIINDAIVSCQKQNRSLPHMLMSGFSGFGKTTISYLIADKIKRPIVAVTGVSLNKPIDVFNVLKSIEKEKFPIIFIDEISSIKKSIAEMFYQPMEIPNTVIQMPSIGAIKLITKVPELTIIGATAGEEGKLQKPFFDRFDIKLLFDYYSLNEIVEISKLSCKKLELNINDSLLKEIARRSCMTPRILNSILRRLRDFTISRNIKKITEKELISLFKLLDIDEYGIDKIGRNMLFAIASNPRQTLGIRAISSMLGIDESTLKRVEQQLLLNGMIMFLSSGRSITEKGLEHIKNYL